MILAATGMRREARIVQRAGLVPVIGGGDAGRLRGLLEAQAGNARAIVSIGIAGALSPELRVGDVVVGNAVTQIPLRNGEGGVCAHHAGGMMWKEPAAKQPWPKGGGGVGAIFGGSAGPSTAFGGPPPRDKLGEEFGWGDRLLAALPGARQGIVCGSDGMVITAAAKARLYEACQTTLPLIIDMESHVAADVARKHNLPFAFIRVISDRADQDLPSAVTCGIKPDGGMAILPVFAALARHPGQLPALIRTARDTDRAMRALLGACDVLARGGIGLPDRG